jgi:hypothetical protein
MWDYIPSVATVCLALLQVWKDWNAHQAHWRRGSVLIVIVVLGLAGVVNVHRTNRKSADQRERDRKQIEELKSNISGLQASVQTANTNQQANTEIFVKSFGDMSQKLTTLETQVKTAGLQKEANQLREDLQKTQKALEPKPKAELTFTFIPFNNTPANSSIPATPITDISLPINPDGSVHIECGALNLTSVDAADVDLNVQICDLCKFTKESANLRKLSGFPDTVRLLQVPHIEGLQVLTPITLDISVPPTTKNFQIGFSYRCSTCVVTSKASMGMIHIQ